MNTPSLAVALAIATTLGQESNPNATISKRENDPKFGILLKKRKKKWPHMIENFLEKVIRVNLMNNPPPPPALDSRDKSPTDK